MLQPLSLSFSEVEAAHRFYWTIFLFIGSVVLHTTACSIAKFLLFSPQLLQILCFRHDINKRSSVKKAEGFPEDLLDTFVNRAGLLHEFRVCIHPYPTAAVVPFPWHSNYSPVVPWMEILLYF